MITQYHRPATLDDAVALVRAPTTRVIIEGAALDPAIHPDTTAVVDLQDLDIGGLEIAGETLTIGAMTTLAELSSSTLTPPMISDLARREAPSTIRNAATVGGVIATNDPESELLAGLIAFNATVTVASANATQLHPIAAIAENPQLIDDSIITDLSIETAGATAAHRTGRTPMDRPIVMVVGHKSFDGHIRLGATGVAPHVIAMSPGQASTLNPPSDFRGTSQYRKALATVLTKRVLADLSGGGPK